MHVCTYIYIYIHVYAYMYIYSILIISTLEMKMRCFLFTSRELLAAREIFFEGAERFKKKSLEQPKALER